MIETALVPQNGTNDITSQFGTMSGFDLLQRQAKMLASSSLVPEQFSFFDKNGRMKEQQAQGYAVANSVIALEIAFRLQASPLMVAQNLIVIHGRPTWSSQFVIAAINASGKFSPLRFDISGEGDARQCLAWAYDKATNDRLEGPPVSVAMAKKEGWYQKNGSKWQSLPELMLRYRAAAFFGRLYAPDLLMGMRSVDEAIDIGDEVIEVQTVEKSKIADINNEIQAAKKAPQRQEVKVQPKEEIPAQDAIEVAGEPQPEAVAPPKEEGNKASLRMDTQLAEKEQQGQEIQEEPEKKLSKQFIKLRDQLFSQNTELGLDRWLFNSQAGRENLDAAERMDLDRLIATRRTEIQAIEKEADENQG